MISLRLAVEDWRAHLVQGVDGTTLKAKTSLIGASQFVWGGPNGFKYGKFDFSDMLFASAQIIET